MDCNLQQFVTKLIADVYVDKIILLTTIQVNNQNWYQYNYDVGGGYLSSLCNMVKFFKVVAKETIVSELYASNVLSARIYQKDAKEIYYVTVCSESSKQLFHLDVEYNMGWQRYVKWS